MIKILYVPLLNFKNFPRRENPANEKDSVKKNSLPKVLHSLRKENPHFLGKLILFFSFQYFEMKAIYFLTLQRPD